MEKYEIPITLFVFRRLDTVKMIVEKLKQVQPSKLYIFADGARDNVPNERERVDRVRQYIIDAIDWECELIPNFRKKNVGYAINIRDGFDYVLNQNPYGIFLEDDAVPNIEFFEFVNLLIHKYESDLRIQYIAGFNGIGKNNIIKDSYTFGMTAPMSGAIATWSNRWKNCDFSVKSWKQRKADKSIKKYYFYNELYRFTSVNLDRAYLNPESEWDIQFGYDMLDKCKYAVVPKDNLVQSFGNIDASHLAKKSAGNNMAFYMSPSDQLFDFPLKEPEKVEWDKNYDKKRQYVFLRVNGNYLQRRLDCFLLKIKEIIYAMLSPKIWRGLKKIIYLRK